MNLQGLTFPDCGTYLVPVGTGDCYAMDKQPKGLIFTTRDFLLPTYDGIDAWANAFDDINNSGMIQYIQEGIVNFEPSGGDLRLSQEGFGPGVVTGLNTYQEVYTIIDGGLCLYKNLLKLHGKRLKVYVIDDADMVLMTYKEERSFTIPKVTKSYFQGFDCNVGVTYRKNNGTNVGAVQITLIYTNYEKEFANASMFKLPRELKQDLGTYLEYDENKSSFSTAQGYKAVFALKTSCGGKSVTDVVSPSSMIQTSMFTIAPLYSTNLYAPTSVSIVRLAANVPYIVANFPTMVPTNVQLNLTANLTSLNKSAAYRDLGLLAPDIFERIIRLSTDA